MKITLCESAGFCFGVSRAVSMVEEKCKNSPVYTYGPVIHNKPETDRLKALGADILENLSLLKKGDSIIIRSHGTSAAEVASRCSQHHYDRVCRGVRGESDLQAERVGLFLSAIQRYGTGVPFFFPDVVSSIHTRILPLRYYQENSVRQVNV